MRKFKPESLMMSHGYHPEWSEGAIKSPIFQTSTFEFKTAEEGKRFFEVAYGHKKAEPDEQTGLIYSRINNPDLEILENRLCLWDEADEAAVFESGMSAISTVMLEFLNPGDLLLMSSPVYGGTNHFTKCVLNRFGINLLEFSAFDDIEEIERRVMASGLAEKLAMVYIETPANPTNAMVDLEAMAELADKFSSASKKVITAVDNTYMGPLWQHPLKHGADLVIYSATKYIAGHSDLIAGAVLGSSELMSRVKALRTFLGNMAGPYTGWLLMRSLETLKVRMTQQAANAEIIAEYLETHPLIEKVYYPSIMRKSDQKLDELMKRQCQCNGAMISFDVKGGEKEAFVFLNNLHLVKLAVSLGSTESLAQHPATMTHVDVSAEDRAKMNITEKLVRLSVGVEDAEDLKWDIDQALEKMKIAAMT
ncbi:MAG: cystathionine gamma-synthase family protein [Flavobacteriales bacterium]|nr:cystathionine gamma-synthase family protein [Flavobacteriales bacterium]